MNGHETDTYNLDKLRHGQLPRIIIVSSDLGGGRRHVHHQWTQPLPEAATAPLAGGLTLRRWPRFRLACAADPGALRQLLRQNTPSFRGRPWKGAPRRAGLGLRSRFRLGVCQRPLMAFPWPGLGARPGPRNWKLACGLVTRTRMPVPGPPDRGPEGQSGPEQAGRLGLGARLRLDHATGPLQPVAARCSHCDWYLASDCHCIYVHFVISQNMRGKSK